MPALTISHPELAILLPQTQEEREAGAAHADYWLSSAEKKLYFSQQHRQSAAQYPIRYAMLEISRLKGLGLHLISLYDPQWRADTSDLETKRKTNNLFRELTNGEPSSSAIDDWLTPDELLIYHGNPKSQPAFENLARIRELLGGFIINNNIPT